MNLFQTTNRATISELRSFMMTFVCHPLYENGHLHGVIAYGITRNIYYSDTIMGVSNHHPHHCLLNRLFNHRTKEKQSSASLAFVRGILRSPVNFPKKMASNSENVSFWWRQHVIRGLPIKIFTVELRYITSQIKPWKLSLDNSQVNCMMIIQCI